MKTKIEKGMGIIINNKCILLHICIIVSKQADGISPAPRILSHTSILCHVDNQGGICAVNQWGRRLI